MWEPQTQEEFNSQSALFDAIFAVTMLLVVVVVVYLTTRFQHLRLYSVDF
jgi:hypothetical protein